MRENEAFEEYRRHVFSEEGMWMEREELLLEEGKPPRCLIIDRRVETENFLYRVTKTESFRTRVYWRRK